MKVRSLNECQFSTFINRNSLAITINQTGEQSFKCMVRRSNNSAVLDKTYVAGSFDKSCELCCNSFNTLFQSNALPSGITAPINCSCIVYDSQNFRFVEAPIDLLSEV